MEKEFGKMKKGEEEIYSMLLLPLEGNVLKVHRGFPASNSRRLREAIALVLFDIKERYTGEKQDTDKFRNEDNERLEEALRMAFDPCVNEDIKEILKHGISSKESKKRENLCKNCTHGSFWWWQDIRKFTFGYWYG